MKMKRVISQLLIPLCCCAGSVVFNTVLEYRIIQELPQELFPDKFEILKREFFGFASAALQIWIVWVLFNVFCLPFMKRKLGNKSH